MSEQLFGWEENPEGIKAAAQQWGSLFEVNGSLAGPSSDKNIHLWNALRAVHPKWRRGAQKIGDCVSWGSELAATTIMALQAVDGKQKWITEAATESIYGLCRVEALNKKRGGRSDGAFGYAAAKAVNKYGILLRSDYSKLTGIDEHDLRKYSGTKAKSWGDYGCGGSKDKGKLDELAKKYPVKQVAQIKTVEELVAAITNGYPVTIASGYGFGRMKRDENGVCPRSGTWYHQMVILGIQHRAGQVDSRCFQSWGPASASGPDPGIEWSAASGCSWWINERTMAGLLKSGDCWAYGNLEGFPKQSISITDASKEWFNPGTGEFRRPVK